MNQQALSAFIWSVADLLRGNFKQSEYGRIILPFTVLRRLDCVLEKTKGAVLAEAAERKKSKVNPEPFLLRKSGQSFYNTSPLDMKKLVGDQDHIRENLNRYVDAFSPNARDIFEHFEFQTQVERLAKAGLLYLVTEKFARIDLHPSAVDNHQMGLVFEELIRKFAELSNETAGEHFTPREVIRLMVSLIFVEDDQVLTAGTHAVRTLYDPTAGTGGMLSVAEEYLRAHNQKASLAVAGQELNPESYAICKADMLIKGQDVANIVFGNTLSHDGHHRQRFDYMLSNPPFGVEWKKVEKEVRREHETKGYNGRFGPGLPRISDGSLLFLLHLIAKMRPVADGGCRFGIVLNGSPLFTGAAGSGESEIRRYVLENDLLEAIVGLPTDMFYNTGIATYVWILSNRKSARRRGKVQLIDAGAMWQKMRKSLGSKRKELSPAHIEEITRLFGTFKEAQRDGLLPESFETYQVIEPGDLVLRLTDLQNDKRSLRTGIVEQRGIITSAYLALRPSTIESRYLAYLLRAYDVTKVFYSMGGGLRQSMKFGDLKRMPTLSPSRFEQVTIADFLDTETAKIDALVADRKMHERAAREFQQRLRRDLSLWARVAVETILVHRIVDALGEVGLQLRRRDRNAIEEQH